MKRLKLVAVLECNSNNRSITCLDQIDNHIACYSSSDWSLDCATVIGWPIGWPCSGPETDGELSVRTAMTLERKHGDTENTFANSTRGCNGQNKIHLTGPVKKKNKIHLTRPVKTKTKYISLGQSKLNTSHWASQNKNKIHLTGPVKTKYISLGQSNLSTSLASTYCTTY